MKCDFTSSSNLNSKNWEGTIQKKVFGMSVLVKEGKNVEKPETMGVH